jgi:hypothetical protein
MDTASLRRKDPVKEFPTSYANSGLTLHFISENKHVIGHDIGS